jgi:hypothetical protein
MHVFLLMLVIIAFLICSISDAVIVKGLIRAPITEQIRINWYVKRVIILWIFTLLVLFVPLYTGMEVGEIGFRRISLNYSGWFSILTFVACGVLLALHLVAAIFRKSYRAELKAEISGASADILVYPRSKKEKLVFIGVSLTEIICQETVFCGLLFFLLMTIFPNIPLFLVVFTSSMMFGIANLYQGLKKFSSAALYGAAYGCLYLVLGSLIPVMLFHLSSVIVGAFVFSEDDGDDGKKASRALTNEEQFELMERNRRR